MQPEDVPQEMHEAAFNALWAEVEKAMKERGSGEIELPSRDDTAIIIAAVIPIIEALENEACARVAETHEWYAGGAGTTFPGSGQALDIARMIRARGT